MSRARRKPTDDATPKPDPTRNDWTAQRYEVRDLSTLRPHPENAHKGDEAAIGESIDENGEFGALGIQASTGHILHGNHTYKQLLARGRTEFACIVYDVNDDLALRICIAHNETQRGGRTDERKMADALAKVSTTRGLGIKPPDVSRLLEMARPKLSFLEKMRAAETALPTGVGELPAGDDGAEEDDYEGDADDREPGGEDFEDEEAAGAPEQEDAEDDGDVPAESGHAPQGTGASAVGQIREADRPRLPLAVVLSTHEMRRWEEYKKRVGEKRDRDAFLVLLAAAQNEDDGKA